MPSFLLAILIGAVLAGCGGRTELPTPRVHTDVGSGLVPTAPSCAVRAPSPTVLFDADGGVTVGSLALDADAVYFTDPRASVVTRVPKCGGPAVALAGPPGDIGGVGASLAVAGGNVAWIELIGAGGEVAIVPTAPGGQARLLASTSQPLSDSIGLDGEHAYFADGAIRSVAIAGGSPMSLVSGWAGIAAIDATNVYFNQSPPTGSALLSVTKEGGAPTVLVPSVHDLNDFAQDDEAIYWLEWNDMGSGSSVMRVPKTGGPAEVVVGGEDSPSGIAVDDVHVYWTVGDAIGAPRAIRRAPKRGGSAETFVSVQPIAFRSRRARSRTTRGRGTRYSRGVGVARGAMEEQWTEWRGVRPESRRERGIVAMVEVASGVRDG
jgi:hypothetical protein